MQTISIESKRKFSIGRRSDVLELLIWLLSTLQKGIDHKGKGPSDKSVIYEPFLVNVFSCHFYVSLFSDLPGMTGNNRGSNLHQAAC